MASAEGRYALAFAEVSLSDAGAFTALKDLEGTIEREDSLGKFLSRRDVPVRERQAMLCTLAKGKNEKAQAFVALLVERGLIGGLKGIVGRIEAELSRLQGNLPVSVETAFEADGGEREQLALWLKKELGEKNITVRYTANQELLAGFIATAGSMRIDMSYRGRLARLQKQLSDRN